MALYLEKTIYNDKVVRYHRITELESGGLVGRVKVESFPSFEDRAFKRHSNFIKWYPMTWQCNYEFLKEAYEYLKTLPDFAGATDA